MISVDELAGPTPTGLEDRVVGSSERVGLDVFDQEDLFGAVVRLDPSVDIVLQYRVSLSSSPSSLPVDALHRPTLDVLARNVHGPADLSHRLLFNQEHLHSLKLLLHGVALVRTPLV